MTTNFLSKYRMHAKLPALSVAIMLFLHIDCSIASEKNDNFYELQRHEYDNAAMCDLILENLSRAKRNTINNGGGKITRISYRTTFPFEPIFRYTNNHLHILSDYIVVESTKIKLIHIANKIYGSGMDRDYIFHQLGIDPNIQSEEISAWCDKLHIIMKLDQKHFLEAEIFTELNE